MKLTKSLLGSLWAVLPVFLALNLKAQFKENFDDGNLHSNPKWKGDTAKLKVISGKLQSQSSVVNDKFYLSTSSKSVEKTQWEFLINLQFNTSSANYVDVFLTSDSANLLSNNSGYFLRIGNTTDNISLLKKSGVSLTTLITGKVGILNHSSNIFKIKVVCDDKRNFTLWHDSTGLGENYVTEGSIIDTGFKTSNYFGMVIRQSTTGFHNRHFFDDFYVGKIITDTVIPFVEKIELKGPDTLRVSFSEKLFQTSLNSLNFEIDNGIGNPSNTRFTSSDSTLIELVLQNSLISNTTYSFVIKNCSDKKGNIMKDTSFRLKWIKYEKPLMYDVVINELFPDPEPTAGLPKVEYIELYNRSDKFLQLQNCILGDKTSGTKLPKMVLEPKKMVILCGLGNEAYFTPFGITVGVDNFPSLNNSGDELFLRNTDGKLIHRVKYDLNSYGDIFKSNGGWSLEMIDPDNPCQKTNYKASFNSIGGTPGNPNSVKKTNPDLDKPSIKSVFIKSSSAISIEFNESLDSFSMVDLANYSINDNGILSLTASFESVEIRFNQPFLPNKIYKLIVKNLEDCSKNIIRDTALIIALAEKALPGDIILNEILFNPPSGGYDFIEIYNRSDKILSLKNLTVFNHNDAQQPDNLRTIDTLGIFILPKQFKVLTTNPTWLSGYYKKTYSHEFIHMPSLPAMDDKSGYIGIAYPGEKNIDGLNYAESMHFQLLTNFEGVSLERINCNISSAEVSNWTSAAATSGFATPGFENSHNLPETTENDWLHISPALISPDEDGIDDLASFTILSSAQNQQVTLIIFDSYGRLINILANNIPIGNSQTWFWDGLDKEYRKTPIGIYIVYAELFGLDGKKHVKKKTVTVGGK